MRTATRILEIFEVFAAQGRPLTLSQLAEALDAPVSSCFGLVKALSDRGYLHTIGTRKELYPTRRMLQNTLGIRRREPVTANFTPVLERLRDTTEETIILGQMNSGSTGVMYLEVIEGPQTIRYTAGVGETKPLYSSAAGKALLGTLPPNRLEAILKKLKLNKITDRTLTSADRLRIEIDKGRKQGYYVTRGENVVDVAAVAMPFSVFDRTFAMAIAGPVERIDSAIGDHVQALRAACKALESLK